MESRSKSPLIGLRERKRRETLRRITDVGISLFIEKGYEAATIDDIAIAAGISRRTFFHYYESKDDILLSLQSGVGALIADEVRGASPDRRPIDVLREAAIKVCRSIPSEDMIAIDGLLRGNASVQARKQASYVQHEQTLFAALRERWPEAERAIGLRLVAMVAIGALRLSAEQFGAEAGARSMDHMLNEAFDAIDAELESVT